MTCVSKEYGIKRKTVHEQWLQVNMLFILGYNLKIVSWGEELTFGEGDVAKWEGRIGKF